MCQDEWIRVLFLAPHMIPLSLPEVVPKQRAINKPGALLGTTPKQTKLKWEKRRRGEKGRRKEEEGRRGEK